ncbi:alpha/beta fold hydrolase [Sediminibacillus halophilus]|uniref:Proline iminopeptidase n=1 Tax=Sediminibacillus halophilus TaxID=482461 RepID=A0A1G9LNN3_9BACI|nr:alpha/beta hydrolase [Sediminibacillus halophilus]SDL63622.1 proline iminopeptidase [Sediminibacillus halophilus]
MLWKRQVVETTRGSFELFFKGDGEPICITHLYSTFNETGDYFADTFTGSNSVYLINLRETGSSVRAEQFYQLSMLETVMDLEAIRRALGFKAWYFAGHSTGGMLGLVYGIYFPDSLTGLVIVGAAARDYTISPFCIYHPDHPDFQRMQQLIEMLKKADLKENQRKALTRERTKLSLYSPETYEQNFDKPIKKKLSKVRIEFFNRELAIYDVRSKLPYCHSNLLILCGKYDVQCPLEFSKEINELVPNSRFITYDKSNHYPFLEEKQSFSRDIHHFLEGEAAH